MEINHKLKIDLVRQGVTPKINVVQGDTCTRKLTIALLSDKSPWPVPAGTSAIIRYLRPDRSSGVYDTLPDGTRAVSISGNSVSILIAPEVLTIPGEVSLVATLILGQKVLSTFMVVLAVQSNCTSALQIPEGNARISCFLPAPQSASPGQHIVVETVDEKGNVLTVQAADLPETEKSAYSYATEGGYTGTESEFAQDLARMLQITSYTGETEDLT